MIRRRTLLALTLTLALTAAAAGCGVRPSSDPVAGQAVPARPTGPPTPAAGDALDRPLPAAMLALPFTDQAGRRVTLGSLHGRTIVLTDFLTTCQEICPMTSVNIRSAAAAVRASGLGGRVDFLEVTVDPQRDTVPRLAAYQQLFGAQPDWSFLTAAAADLATLWRVLGVAYQRVAEDDPPARDWLTGKPLTYDVTHQDVVFVLDERGHERWLTEGTPATGGIQPPARLTAFLSATGRANLASPPAISWTVADVSAAVAWVTGHRIGGPGDG